MAEPERTERKIGDRVRVDEFAWLEDPTSARSLEYMRRETEFALASNPLDDAAREAARKLADRRVVVPTIPPVPFGGYLYQTVLAKDPKREVLVRRKGVMEAGEEIVVDARPGSRAVPLAMTPDHAVLASEEFDGARRFVRFREPGGRGNLPDKLGPAKPSTIFLDSTTVLWVQTDARGRGWRLIRHTLGTPTDSDILITEEKDPVFDMDIRLSHDRKLIFIESHSPSSSEVAYIPFAKRDDDPKVVFERRAGVRYRLEHFRDRFLILTNQGAPGFKVTSVPESDPYEQFITPLVPETDQTDIEDWAVFKNHLVLLGHRREMPVIRVRELTNDVLEREAKDYEVALLEGPHTARMIEGAPFDADSIRFEGSSVFAPRQILDLQLSTGKLVRVGGARPSDFDPSAYRLTSMKLPSGGTLRLFHGAKAPKPSPTVLVATCARGCPLGFDPRMVALLEAGLSVAYAPVRSGAELVEAAKVLIGSRASTAEMLALLGSDWNATNVVEATRMSPESFRIVWLDEPVADPITVLASEPTPSILERRAWLGDPRIAVSYDVLKRVAPYDVLPESAREIFVSADPIGEKAARPKEPSTAAKLVAKLRKEAPKVRVRAWFASASQPKDVLFGGVVDALRSTLAPTAAR